ncbi:2-keto-4-pentenoate hydratase [Saccharopolyspora gregorii]|uniref:Fumarylacetoacetate hydrolase family protein n=1 Tax=Saccharopolyspora gregorii TaxID=33914 RepID=A0ABP6RRJ4_9PSEU
MQDQDIRDVATLLRDARANRTPVPAPTTKWPDLDADAAFAVQRHNAELAVAGGDRIVGYKLGNIAKAMQAAFGLDRPDYGYLLASGFAPEGVPIARDRFIAPFVELEPAFLLAAPLRGPNVTVADVIGAVDCAMPAIEIIDSRVQDWAISLPDTVADNGSTGAVLLGGTPRRLTELRLSDTRGALRLDGREVVAGNTRNVLGNPLAATAWLCNRLADYGIGFEAGQVVLPGSCLEAVPVDRAGHWSGEFTGWGSVEFEVTE